MTPDPYPMTEAQAITTLRAIARLQGGFAIKVYQAGKEAMPVHRRVPIALAILTLTKHGILRKIA